MVDGTEKVILLLKVDGCYGGKEVTAAAGFHFNEYDSVVFFCNDIYIPMAGMPVAFQDDITFLAQIGSSQFLAPYARLQMCRAIFGQSVTDFAPFQPCLPLVLLYAPL